MHLGLFMAPHHPPERTPLEAAEWNLDLLGHADELGFREAWIGEHFTIQWEPVPEPDILIAQALRETSRMIFAPGAHLLPYHNPVQLAHQVAYLDHLAQGRYMLGVGAGVFPSDATMFGLDHRSGDNHKMMLESLEIMKRIWTTDGAFEFDGTYWKAGRPEWDEILMGPWLKPFQMPHPPIGMAGTSARSESLRMAGEIGAFPISTGDYDVSYLQSQWETFAEGAATAGRTPDRSQWRVSKNCFVADTDEEAMAFVTGQGHGRFIRDYALAVFKKNKVLEKIAPGGTIDTGGDLVDFLARERYLVGSPGTVARQMAEINDASGGFGTLLVQIIDTGTDLEPWKRSLTLLADEVLPQVRNLATDAQMPASGPTT